MTETAYGNGIDGPDQVTTRTPSHPLKTGSSLKCFLIKEKFEIEEKDEVLAEAKQRPLARFG